MKKRLKDIKIFSDGHSSEMWEAINAAKTVADLRDALYFVCCRLQELEALTRGGRDAAFYRKERALRAAERSRKP